MHISHYTKQAQFQWIHMRHESSDGHGTVVQGHLLDCYYRHNANSQERKSLISPGQKTERDSKMKLSHSVD